MENTTKETQMEDKIMEISLVAIAGIMQGNMIGNYTGQFNSIKNVINGASEIIDYIRKKGE